MYRILLVLCGWVLKNASLVQLAQIFEILSVKLFEHRMNHNGFVPLEVFPACVGMGGSAPNFEVVVKIDDSFVLKRRGEKESGWTGQYHVVGANCLITDGPDDVFLRLTREIHGDDHPPLALEDLQRLTLAIYHVPPRRLFYWTTIFCSKLTAWMN